MRIADLLRTKGSEVATVTEEATVAELVSGLAEHNIGAMIVIGPDGVAGIVSERDVVRGLHDDGVRLLGCPVREIMTTIIATCTPEDFVDDLSAVMTEHRIRHVPVLTEGDLRGIVSIGDVVKTRLDELERSHEHLEAYIAQG